MTPYNPHYIDRRQMEREARKKVGLPVGHISSRICNGGLQRRMKTIDERGKVRWVYIPKPKNEAA